MRIDERGDHMELAELNIAIVGLGLMGGSLAMALKGATRKVVGFDRDPGSRDRAVELGIVDETAALITDGIADADLVVLAIPVEGIVSMLHSLPEWRADGCMVMDLGSTKGQIGEAMQELPEQFAALGGHPMCGREQSGLAAATGDLYKRETFILCRNRRTTKSVEAAALALVGQIGAQPLFLPAAAHDKIVAASSHLPYVVSSLLMGRAWAEAEVDRRLWRVSASGLRDTTRLAGSSPEMMLEIMLTNQAFLLAQMEAYSQELGVMMDALRQKDRGALRAMLEAATQRRAAYMLEKSMASLEGDACEGDNRVSSTDGIG